MELVEIVLITRTNIRTDSRWPLLVSQRTLVIFISYRSVIKGRQRDGTLSLISDNLKFLSSAGDFPPPFLY